MPAASGGDDQRKGTDRFGRARQGNFPRRGLRGLPPGRACEHGGELRAPICSACSGPKPRMREVAEGADGTPLPDQGRARIPAALGARTGRSARGGGNRPDARPGLSTRDAGIREGDPQRPADRRLGDYLATLNVPGEGGPVVKLIDQAPAPPYDPMADSLQWLVGDAGAPAARTAGGHLGPQHPRRQSQRHQLQLRPAPAGGGEDLAGRLPRHGGRAGQSRQPRPGAGLRQPRDLLRRTRVPAGAAERRGPAHRLLFQGRQVRRLRGIPRRR